MIFEEMTRFILYFCFYFNYMSTNTFLIKLYILSVNKFKSI